MTSIRAFAMVTIDILPMANFIQEHAFESGTVLLPHDSTCNQAPADLELKNNRSQTENLHSPMYPPTPSAQPYHRVGSN